jgi:proteic killer suppression protein
MEFEFKNKKLEELYTKERGAHRYPPEVIKSFFRLMAVIDNAPDERDLRELKSLHFEKLDGANRSMRLNEGWRLIIELLDTTDGKKVIVKDMNNHYGE